MTDTTELATTAPTTIVERHQTTDPTGGRLVRWAEAASAANSLAVALCRTSFVPAAFRDNAADTTAAVLLGDELGLSPLAALRSVYVVHGTPSTYTRTMVALVQSQGHEVWTEKSSDTEVVVCARRRGTEHVERSSWTIARARQAGYTNNAKYRTNPEEMLWAKAAATVCRRIAADVLLGVPYSVEDLELDNDTTTTTTTRTSTPTTGTTRRTRAKATEPAPPADEPPLPGDEPEVVVEAEVVEDTPPPANPDQGDGLDEFAPDTTHNPDPSDTETPPPGINRAQSTKLHALMNSFGLRGGDADRDYKLRAVAALIGRHVASSNELTKDEAVRLIDALERVSERDDPRGNLDSIIEMAEATEDGTNGSES